MTEPFKGLINVDIRDSKPDWAPFEPPKAPDGAPNVVYIVLDDVGFSAMSCYGGPIPTPNIDRIAADGVRYTQWHTTALCSPTRSCLLTGRNHTRNSMACITEAAVGFPNASGTIPPENGMLPEILGELGWNTYMVGKWHLCPTDEMNLAAPRRNWPSGRGFERWYGFLGAESNQWYPDLVYDNHPVDPPKTPEEGYHLTEDLTEKALEFIKDAKAIAPDKPFFLYYAPGACHAPHHAPREWIDKFKGQFDMGYEAMREQILARQKEMGLVPSETELLATQLDRHHRDPHGTRRQAVPAARRDQALGHAVRQGEAALLHARPRSTPGSSPTRTSTSGSCSTTSSGRACGTTRSRSWCRTTAPAARVVPTGRSTRTCFSTGSRTTWTPTSRCWMSWRPQTYNDFTNGWLMAFEHALQDVEALRVQRRHREPSIISWPAGTKARGEIREQYHHAIDIVPTVLDCLGVEGPATIKGHVQSAFDGVSMRYAFDDAKADGNRKTQFYSMLGSRGIWHEGWKAITTHPTIAGWSHFNDDEWELYHTDVDRSELHDLAKEDPAKLRELQSLWFAEAGETARSRWTTAHRSRSS